ncbi:MAG: hypothetical protein AUH78_08405 [Gemmatimonadetes bacterium 13_1_40CM_4_69_8]|nr:MAG: hypothetical protein AUH78_08405 [Gemmatimonadetes bacterium 13_1_40CM_4_69_8]OLE64847.1 MAG: hypothetical protein AUG03_07565 [Acidobacteria bacterium 13_1_20CM_2_68_14]PYP72180.1 MAG: hypothetical protein DMD41_09840 [Gemmatimonadota bacterium]
MRHFGWLLVLAFASPTAAPAQNVQNATLRRALAAYDNLDIGQAILLAKRALTERLSGLEQARAYELLGFAYSASDSLLKGVDAFKQAILIDPDRQLDPAKISPKITSSFLLALSQVLVVRQLQVDSASFVGGKGFVPIRFTVTSPARVRTRAVSGATSVPIDSSVATGQVNLRWQAQLPNGDPVPDGNYLIVVEATAGQNSFSASQTVKVTHGAVDTLPHLTALPGYAPLPEEETPPRNWTPLGRVFLYTGIVGAGTFALESSRLGSAPRRELAAVSVGAILTGFIMSLKKPAPQPARGNILYNRLLREQLVRRNADIAQQNQSLRRQVALKVVPLPKSGGGGGGGGWQ